MEMEELEDRVKYFEFLRNNNTNEFSEWLKQLSLEEKDRLIKFGYKQ